MRKCDFLRTTQALHGVAVGQPKSVSPSGLESVGLSADIIHGDHEHTSVFLLSNLSSSVAVYLLSCSTCCPSVHFAEH